MKTNKPDSGFWSYAHPRIRRIASYYSCEALPFRSSVTRFKSCHSKRSFSSCTAANEKYISQDVAKHTGFDYCTSNQVFGLATGSSVARFKPRHSKHGFSSCAAANEKYISQDVAKHTGFDYCTSNQVFDLATGSRIARFKPRHSQQSFSSCAAAKLCFVSPRHSQQSFSSCAHPHTRSIASRLAAGSSVARFKPASGFTLLEVMVALAIFAIAAVVVTKVGMQYTQSTANAILRTKAQFVAMNEAAQMEINKQWLIGTESKQITSQGETWQIDKRSESTISPNVQRVEIQVSLFNNEQGKVESGITNIVFFNYPQQVKTQ
ncbi:type II secretion system minor pseudopilin GspI [Acinetobacter ursingii]